MNVGRVPASDQQPKHDWKPREASRKLVKQSLPCPHSATLIKGIKNNHNKAQISLSPEFRQGLLEKMVELLIEDGRDDARRSFDSRSKIRSKARVQISRLNARVRITRTGLPTIERVVSVLEEKSA